MLRWALLIFCNEHLGMANFENRDIMSVKQLEKEVLSEAWLLNYFELSSHVSLTSERQPSRRSCKREDINQMRSPSFLNILEPRLAVLASGNLHDSD